MPKQTFFNLPEKKRERIINAALEEFSENLFSKASINKIVEKAKIPKGSFYQYFKNKKDLYKYILDQIFQLKIKYISDSLKNRNSSDFFESFEAMIEAGFKLTLDYPLYAKIGQNFMLEDRKFVSEITEEYSSQGENFVFSLLKKAQDNGEIYEHIDLKMVSFLISKISIFILDYIKQNNESMDYENIKKILNDFMFIIKNGIRRGKNDKD
ncbi:TetR/AcrR family transcriptional regulator [Marinitoga aeolica]|uniref:TetR/AcrR family transcriptional regulator n=1 Tax=Marinitoga aeolica TaxID=2809031 RepID=A0ABY8PSP2_9BACT|nr:TetR/AcrR family transcriptional regulator [Marinitoga aeolica]WGS65656.1 TetR/AcrR family transcriptional regulator [Marinitoga aeolica]